MLRIGRADPRGKGVVQWADGGEERGAPLDRINEARASAALRSTVQQFLRVVRGGEGEEDLLVPWHFNEPKVPHNRRLDGGSERSSQGSETRDDPTPGGLSALIDGLRAANSASVRHSLRRLFTPSGS